MKPVSAAKRILGALALSPMTAAELMRCLDLGKWAVYGALDDLMNERRIRVSALEKPPGEHPRYRYALT